MANSLWNTSSIAGIVVAGIVWLIIYSYLAWRDAPDKIAPAGIQKNTFSSK